MAPIAPAFSKKNRFVGTLEFAWLVLCLDIFRIFVVFNTFDCRSSHQECWNFQEFLCFGRLKVLQFARRCLKLLKFSGGDASKNAGISKMSACWAVSDAEVSRVFGVWGA